MQLPTDNDMCPHCDKTAGWDVRVAEITVRYGAVSVVDKSMVLPHCRSCGTWFIGSHERRVVELRTAIAAISDTGGTLNGDGLCFVRRVLGLKQDEFARMLGYKTKEHVSRWETGGVECPRSTQIAVIPFLSAILRGDLSTELIRYFVANEIATVISYPQLTVSKTAA